MSTIHNITGINLLIEMYAFFISIFSLMAIMHFDYKSQFKNIMQDMWKYIFMVNCITITCDMLSNLFAGYISPGARMVTYLTSTAVYVLNFLLLILFIVVLNLQLNKDQLIKHWMLFCCAVFGAYCILLIFNMRSGWIFSYDNSNYYREGPFSLIPLFIYLVIIFGSVVILIIKRKKLEEDLIKFYGYTAVFILLAVIFQAVLFEFSIAHLSISISLLLLYIIIQHSMIQRYMKEEQQLIEYKNLSMMSQLQPHFLYNSLTAIMGIEGNPPETKKAISDFAKYLRGNLDSIKSRNLIPFEQELKHVEAYVNLEKLRFGDKLNVIYKIETVKFEVPVLCVQMMVENAIKHGITPKKGKGTVNIIVKELPV